jgi:hypothetical protein
MPQPRESAAPLNSRKKVIQHFVVAAEKEEEEEMLIINGPVQYLLHTFLFLTFSSFCLLNL